MLAPAAMVDELAGLTGCEFSYSANANPISCAAGLAVLDEFERHRLVERAHTTGLTLRQGLEAITEGSPILGQVRGLGMLLAIEMVADKDTKEPLPERLMPTERIRIHGLNNGIMLYSRPSAGGRFGHWFMVAPPLTINADECQELLRRSEAAVGDFHDELKISGAL
jgi:adenosylmethionine-8-amino-7-oxononanoate aminotransferase